MVGANEVIPNGAGKGNVFINGETNGSAPASILDLNGKTETINGLRGKGVQVTSEPRPLPLPNGPSINFSYVAGPAGARIELVERPGLKPGE